MTQGRPLLNRRLAEFGTTIFAEMSALAAADRLDQPRPGLPRHRRPRGDPRGRGPRAARRPRQPVPAGPRRPRAAHRDRRPPAAPVRPRRTTPTPRSWSRRAPPRPSPRPCSPCVEPGDEVIALEPYYDSYAACIAMAGGTRVPVTLRPHEGGLPARPRRAARRRHRPHPAAAAQHPAQPDRHRPHPRGADRDRRARRRAGPARGHRRGVRAPGLRRGRAHAARRASPACASGRSPSARRARPSRSPAGRSAG